MTDCIIARPGPVWPTFVFAAWSLFGGANFGMEHRTTTAKIDPRFEVTRQGEHTSF
jgi:hypothetical protein